MADASISFVGNKWRDHDILNRGPCECVDKLNSAKLIVLREN